MPGVSAEVRQDTAAVLRERGLRASMVFEDNMAALRDAAIIGVFAVVVFILGIIATKWEEDK